MVAAWMFIVFLVALLIGVPIYAAIGGAALLAVCIDPATAVQMVPLATVNGIDNFVLIAVALFFISGALMQASGMTEEILSVADAFVGHIYGGIGATTIVASAFFAALTGSGLAATVAIGSITIGGMVSRGYKKPLAGAVAASGGALGVLIPPSNPMIIYGVLSGTSIGMLFAAGLIPGLLITASLSLVMMFIGKKNNLKDPEKKFSWRHALIAAWRAKWALLAPFVILGSIYLGIATPTEAAEIAVVYALFYGCIIKRKIKFKTIVRAFMDGAMTSAIMLIMSGVASGFGRIITLYQVPQTVGIFITSITDNPQLIMLMILVMLFFTGCFMETLSQVIILTPIFLPILLQLGVDPIVFGVIFVLMIEIGFLTPPIGGNLFVAVKLCDNASLMDISKAEIPFILVFLSWAVIFVFFPEIITFLPNLLKGIQ